MTTVTAYTSLNMIDPVVWYGSLQSYDASHITLSDGFKSGTYFGAFTYDAFGNVFGTLTGFRTSEGRVLAAVFTGGNVNAYDFYVAIQSGNGVLAASMVMTGNDLVNGSASNDALAGHLGADTLIGNDGDDRILGGSGSDVLNGGAGLDVVYGDNGNDRVVGGAGADVLSGGNGADLLVGGAGKDVLIAGVDSARDVFDFNSAAESAVGNQRDRIAQFVHRTDIIDVSTLDANTATVANDAFAFAKLVPHANSVWVTVVSGGVVVSGDINGNTVADFEILLTNVTTLTAIDFSL